jgi:WD40 repeat protein
LGCKAIGAEEFLEATRRQLSPPAILTERLSLTPLGPETARLEGHSNWVATLCVLPDCRLASGSADKTIRLWDVKTGAETARLEGHSDSVATLCALPDGRLASGSLDATIRLWDVKTGAETARLEMDAPVDCVLALSTLHLVAGDGLGRLHWLEVVDRGRRPEVNAT